MRRTIKAMRRTAMRMRKGHDEKNSMTAFLSGDNQE
jgi:hypothetical protein